MGWGLPAAIGSYFSLRKKNRKVICLTGEGGLQMNYSRISNYHASQNTNENFYF